MEGCDPRQVCVLLDNIIESSLAYCGYYKSPARLERLAVELAKLAGFEAKQANDIGLAASLCDLGMVAMPHELLGKEGALRPHEREIMQTHTAMGQELLSGVDHPVFRLAARVAATHHERMDGGGYPKGLTAENIPVEARIVSAVSIYVALTQPRPFRNMRTHEQAIELLTSLAGAHLDAELVQLLLDHQDDFRFRPEDLDG